jgi:hypothetical protein
MTHPTRRHALTLLVMLAVRLLPGCGPGEPRVVTGASGRKGKVRNREEDELKARRASRRRGAG